MRVLVVDDEVRLADTIRRGLTAEGFTVDIVHDGVEGLWAATEQQYDVIVLDLMLPQLNGYRVLEQLRARQVWTPVLMLTAKDGDHEQADALDLGADDYLTKPFSFVVLTARLRALLRRGTPERPAVLAAGDLTLDPLSRRVTRSGKRVELTPREFHLLEFFLRNKGRVVSKSEIVEHVWDPGFRGPLNVVEVYVGYLRRKLDDPFDRHALCTVRGAGYRLAEDGG
ncbi:MAG: response regulator transcription factor [Actinomycetota bacterium]|nr:MAG: response regulator transcription factor [Actinomycetota bacterium]